MSCSRGGTPHAQDETLLVDLGTAHLVKGDKPQLYEFQRTIALDVSGASRASC